MNAKSNRRPTRRTGACNAVGHALAEMATKLGNDLSPVKARLALQKQIMDAAINAGADKSKMPTLGSMLTAVLETNKHQAKLKLKVLDPIDAEIKAAKQKLKELRAKKATAVK